MKILMVNSLYPPSQVGGAEKSVSYLAEALSERGHSVSVVSLHQETTETVELQNGVRVYRVPLDNDYWPYSFSRKPSSLHRLIWHLRDSWNGRAAERFARILELEKPDVVHTNVLTGFSVALWKVARRKNIRTVHTLRDYSLMCVRSSLFRNGRTCNERCAECRLLTTPRRLASERVDMVISNSDFVLRSHRKYGFFKGRPGAVTYNIADVAIRQRAPRSSSDPLTLGFIGRVEPEKGIEVLLKASIKFQGNWILKIAGRGLEDYMAGLRTKYSSDRIEWLGFVDARSFYQSIDVCVIPSVWPEPLPRTLIEAYANGCSAICADSGGTSEIASLGKVHALYPPEDAERLAQIVNEAIVDPSLWRSGGLASADAVKAFSKAEITARYEAAYRGASLS